MTNLQKKPKLLKTVKTPRMFDEDLFYFNNKDDEEEVLETLGYNQRYTEEDDQRIAWKSY